MNGLSRRAFMRKAAAATTVAATSSVASAGADDSAIFALAAEFEAARRAMKAYEPIHTAAESREFALRPEVPVRPEMPKHLVPLARQMSIAEFGDDASTHPVRVWFRESAVAHEEAMERYEEGVAAAELESGWGEADAIYHELVGKVSQIAERLIDERAYTLQGVLTKARIVAEWEAGVAGSNLCEALIENIQGIVARGAA